MDSVLNQKNIDVANIQAEKDEWSFNCWGATMYVLEQKKELRWVNRDSIEEFLNEKTKIVQENDLKIGDILVLSGDEDYNGYLLTLDDDRLIYTDCDVWIDGELINEV